VAAYGWVPFTDIDCEVSLGSDLLVGEMCKCLPMADGSPMAQALLVGRWSEIVENDTLLIVANGGLYTTEVVAWISGYGVIRAWTPTQLAEAIFRRLGAPRSFLNIDYHLLAGYSANNITPWIPSFGKKLSKAMKKLDMHGSLTAYKGVNGMRSLIGYQVGSSRSTYALSRLRHFGRLSAGRATMSSTKTWLL